MHSDTDRDADANRHADAHINTDGDSNANGDANRGANGYTYSHSYSNASDLIPGGGSLHNDCTQEWLTDSSPSPDRRGLPAKRLECTDDDPTCDFGATTWQACTFHVAMCFNATEQRFACTPSDVRQVKVLQPGLKPRYPVTPPTARHWKMRSRDSAEQVQGTCTRPGRNADYRVPRTASVIRRG